MARTKQTARMAYVGKGCVGGKGAKGKVGGGKGDRGGKVAKSSSPAADEDHPGVSTQQFSVKFDDQPKCEQQMVQGKLITCTNCPAILTAQNKIHTVEEYAAKRNDPTLTDAVRQKYFDGAIRVWICEFCLSHNKIPKNFNAPAVDNPCYLIRKGNAQKMDAEEDNANKLLIFCIDVSSSMETYVETKSRLEAVKEAIADELSRMKAEKENFNVGLIAFGSSVTLIGTKKGQEKLDSQIYEDFDKIVAASSKIKEFCKSVQTNFASLKKNVNELTIYGSTALGPALLAAVELASKGAVGSKVLLCTDGEANVGLGGSFNPQSVQFYNKMADYAKGKRVMVSILSIKGDNCNLKQLGKLSLATGGSVLKIDPKKLGTEFSKIVKQEILGSESSLVITVNKIFEIVSPNPNELSKDKTTMTQDYGNFTAETQLTFAFHVLTEQEAKKKGDIDLNLFMQPKVPMQVQLTYTSRNGSKYLQIITDWRELTQDKNQIYQGMNFGLFAASVLQTSSACIRREAFEQASNIISGYHSLVKEKFAATVRKVELDKFNDRVKKIEDILKSKQKKMQKKTGVYKAKTATKSKGKKPSLKSKPIAKAAKPRRSRRGRRNQSESASQQNESVNASDEEQSEAMEMESDSQEQVLYREARARSRSVESNDDD